MGSPKQNRIRRGAGELERIEAHFWGRAYSPHRHDTYTIGITLNGVQSFDYRGSTRHSLPGQLVILHPDELHDGRAGDGGAFAYRAAYIEPALIQEMLDGKPLPFFASAVSDAPALRPIVASLLGDFDEPLSKLEQDDLLYDLAVELRKAAGATEPAAKANRSAALRARQYIDANIDQGFSLAELGSAIGYSRWQLSRDFRTLFGTSPYRYLVARRLHEARRHLLDGAGIADAAIASGFADQSHFGRLFKKQYGLTPNAWLDAMRRAA